MTTTGKTEDNTDMIKAVVAHLNPESVLTGQESAIHNLRLEYIKSQTVEDPKDPLSLSHYPLERLISFIEFSYSSHATFTILLVCCLTSHHKEYLGTQAKM